jgi:hypothetical protein
MIKAFLSYARSFKIETETEQVKGAVRSGRD